MRTPRGILYIFVGFLLTAPRFGTVFAQGAPPGEREALQKELEKEFVAPCCWTEAVATHQSGAAEEVKALIGKLLDEGKTRTEIRAYMVSKYGERILITPEARGFNLMVWIFPGIGLLIGLVFVVYYLYRNRPRAVGPDTSIPPSPPPFQ